MCFEENLGNVGLIHSKYNFSHNRYKVGSATILFLLPAFEMSKTIPIKLYLEFNLQ